MIIYFLPLFRYSYSLQYFFIVHKKARGFLQKSPLWPKNMPSFRQFETNVYLRSWWLLKKDTPGTWVNSKFNFNCNINQLIISMFSSPRLLPLTHHNLWSQAGLEISDSPLPHSTGEGEGGVTGTPCCPLLSLNLAHNLFTSVPPVLPCLAVNLTKLNIAYNR